jgi:hypothetical protein
MFVLHAPVSIDNFHGPLKRGQDVSSAPVFCSGGALELPAVSAAVVKHPAGSCMGNPLIDLQFNCQADAWDWFQNRWAPALGSNHIYEWDCLLGAGMHSPAL